MKKIPLTKGLYALVDNNDYDILSRYKWYYGGPGYAMRSITKRIVYMHRVIMKAPRYMLVDHVNHNTLDNRKANLRLCTEHQSNGNRRPQKRGKSKFKGVFAVSKSRSWRAQLNKNGKTIYLGCYQTEEEAAKAYNKAAKEYFGAFAWLNPV